MPRIPFAALAVVALGLATAACTPPEERAAAYTARAGELFAAGDLDKAGVEARNAVQIQPKNAAARWLLVQIAEKKGQLDQMVNHLAVVIEEDPKNAAAKIKLGALLVNAQDYEGAAALVEELQTLAPDDPAVQVLRARLALQKQDWQGAVGYLDKALAGDERNLEALSLRATVIALQNPEQGLAEYARAIDKLGPIDSRPIRQLRVDLLARLGRVAEVEKELRALIADFGAQLYYDNLARFYMGQNRPDEAEAVLREAVAADPANVRAKVEVARFQSVARRKPEEAEQTLKAYIAEDPENLELQTHLANFYEGGNRNDEALGIYEKVAAAAPTSAEGLAARNRIAALKLRAGRIDEGRERLDGILQDEPDNLQALLARGDLNFAAGRHEEAIADLRGVLRREPENVLGLTLLAQTHLATGDRALAEDAWRRLLRADPKNVEGLVGLATLVGEMQEVDEAQKLLDAALANAPQDPQALELAVGIALNNKDFRTAEKHARALAASEAAAAGVGQRELARVFEAEGKFGPAVDAYRKALEQKPDSAFSLEGVVRSLYLGKRGAEAAPFLTEHLERYPDHVMARVLLADTLLRERKLEEARAAAELAIEQQPELVRAYIVLATTYQDDPAARIGVFERGLKAKPGSGDLALLLAGEHQNAGRPEEAIKVLEQALESKENAPRIANNLAALLIDHRRDDKSHARALEIAKRFANTQNPMYLDTLGWAYYHNEDMDSAIRYLELAVVFGGNEPIVRYHLGMAYLAADNKVGAKEELGKAVAKVPPGTPWLAEAQATLAKL